MRATAVVEIEIADQELPSGGNGFVAVQMNRFVFHGFPWPFDKDLVTPAASAIHANLDVVLFKHADER